jgi:hypothetical protein
MIPKPDSYFINKLRRDVPCLFYEKDLIGAKKSTDINLLHIPDYLNNWEILDDETRADVRTIIEGKWEISDGEFNRSSGGIKKKSEYPLPEQLLLFAGLGIRDMVCTAPKIIPSNVRDQRGYRHPHGTSLGFIDPRAANDAYSNFSSKYSLSRLMPHYSATRVLFNSHPDLWSVGDRTDKARDRFNLFYDGVSRRLDKWHDQGSIKSCLARFEISVVHLAGSKFKPHVHAVVWHTPDHNRQFLHNAYERGEIEEIQEPQAKWRDIKGFIRYMFQVSPFSDRYRIEWDKNSGEILYQLSRKALWKLIELHIHPGAQVHKDREFKRNLPPHGKGRYY